MSADRLEILYQDSALLAVEKPAGMHTAPLRPGEKGTLLGMVIEAFPEVAGLPGVKPVEPGLVHRLDRETSGLIVVALTSGAFAALRELFTTGRARKTYLAACGGAEARPREGQPLRIASRFAPYGEGRRKVRVVAAEDGRQALRRATRVVYTTEAEIAARGPGRTLLRARIERGFRHQVRAHLSALGYPILGDPLYGVVVPAGFSPRMYLHATRIEMPHPVTGAPLILESPAPAEFESLFPGGRAPS